MPVDLSEILVIGVSSRSLFSLEHENEIFTKEGIVAFRKYQEENEHVVLAPGAAFYLIEKLLALNKIASKQIVEIVVMSTNSPETGMRVMNSINKHHNSLANILYD